MTKTLGGSILNLALDRWIPVVHKSGKHRLIAPWEVNDAADPVVEVAAVRPSSNGALTEFLIALHTTVLLPDDAREWRNRWNDPPSPEYLRKEFFKVAPLFELGGEMPFMQDRSLSSDPEKFRKPVQKLLVDGVSDNQEKHGADLFVKSGAISALCLPCAAAALWDLQAHAPQGSASYYTCLRGGGPITTLVRCPDSLWKTVWANVVEQAHFGMKGRPDPVSFLPWIAPVPKDDENYLKPSDVSPLHVFWSMPRRVMLEISGSGTCDTCGAEANRTVPSFLTYRGGVKYSELDWSHPLSPYVRRKEGDGSVVRNTVSDLEGYRHWMGLLIDTPNGDGLPAFVVRRWLERDVPREPQFNIWAYGWQADQAAIRRWCEGLMPYVTPENGHRKDYEAFVRTLIALSQRAVEHLAGALKDVWKRSNHDTPFDYSHAQHRFWASTGASFLEEVSAAAADPLKEKLSKSADAWVKTAQQTALRIYELAIPEERTLPEWRARYAHKLRRLLSSRNPVTMKTKLYGDWRITDV